MWIGKGAIQINLIKMNVVAIPLDTNHWSVLRIGGAYWNT